MMPWLGNWGIRKTAHLLPMKKKNPQPLAYQEVAEWRRRGSNPKAEQCKHVAEQQLTDSEHALSGNCQDHDVTDWLDLSSIDAGLRQVVEAWNTLSDIERKEILKCMNDRNSSSTNL